MKFVALLVGFLLIIPVRNAIQGGRISVGAFWFAIGMLCFVMPYFPMLGIAIISWPAFPGHTAALEISVIDLGMATYLLTLPKATDRLAFTKAMTFYFLCVLASMFQAESYQPTLFYAWQLLRMFLVYLVVARASADDRVIPALISGWAFGLLIEGGLVLVQRFLGGDSQPNGTFAHQNYLGFVSNLAFIPIVALQFYNRVPLLLRLGLLSGGIVAVLTASRATLGLSVMGTMLVVMYSLASGEVKRSAKFLLVALFIALPLTPLAMENLEMRFGQFDPNSDYDERAAFKSAAAMMVQDHPLGVGANNFVIAANVQGYYDRAEVAYTSRSATVHNLYYLTAAETGYSGLLALILLLLLPLVSAFRNSLRHRGQEESLLLGGLGISLTVAYAHAYFEWIPISQYSQYLLAIIFGLIAGISGRLNAGLPENMGKPEISSEIAELKVTKHP